MRSKSIFTLLLLLLALPSFVSCTNNSASKGDELLYFVLSGDLNKTEELINAGVNINYQNSPLRTGVLHACLSNKVENVEMLALLLQKGADINMQNSEGSTSLKYAVVNNHIASIKLLLENGADMNLKDRYGSTAVNLLDADKDADIVKLLNDYSSMSN